MALTGLLLRIEVFKRVDADLTDTHARLNAPKAYFRDTVVMVVGKDSVSGFESRRGLWPYGREVNATFIQCLLRTPVRTVGCNIRSA